MKEINLPNNLTILALDLPYNGYYCKVHEQELIIRKAYQFHQEQLEVKLPQGDWQLLGKFGELKFEQIYNLIPYFECPNQWCENGFIDMGYNEKWRCQYCQENEDTEDLDKFASLLRSQGIEPNDNTVILIKR